MDKTDFLWFVKLVKIVADRISENCITHCPVNRTSCYYYVTYSLSFILLFLHVGNYTLPRLPGHIYKIEPWVKASNWRYLP